MTTVSIKDTDRGAKRLAKLLANGALKVGVLAADAGKQHEDEHGKKSDITIGEVAEIHEFGLGVPRRSFLAGWFDESKDQIASVIVRGGQALVTKKVASMPALLEQIGGWAVGSIQTRMANNIPPPLAESTIRQKGSSVALIDSGQLRSSITYEVDGTKAGGK